MFTQPQQGKLPHTRWICTDLKILQIHLQPVKIWFCTGWFCRPKTACVMVWRKHLSINCKPVQGECTLMRTISSGMFIMALVSQLSRLLAKLRMAWVKAPGDSRKKGLRDFNAFASEQAVICYLLRMCPDERLSYTWEIQLSFFWRNRSSGHVYS